MNSTGRSNARRTFSLVWILGLLLIGVAVALGYLAFFVPSMLETRALWLLIVIGMVLAYLLGDVLLEYQALELYEALSRPAKIGAIMGLLAVYGIGMWLGLRWT